MSVAIDLLLPHWAVVEPILSIRSESDYYRALEQLDELLDEIGDDEAHPLYNLLDTLVQCGVNKPIVI